MVVSVTIVRFRANRLNEKYQPRYLPIDGTQNRQVVNLWLHMRRLRTDELFKIHIQKTDASRSRSLLLSFPRPLRFDDDHTHRQLISSGHSPR